MNKIIDITISGVLFHIEDNGYKQLDGYLKSIQEHFASYEEREEILKDIEARIAEQFTNKMDGQKSFVSNADVDELIKVMGNVEDFEKFEAQHHAKPHSHEGTQEQQVGEAKKIEQTQVDTQEPVVKKFYRNPDDMMIAGVCSGLSLYFGIDVTLMRVIFVVLGLFTGIGLILYIILWIVMPMARTPLQKMEMRGEPMTLSHIQQNVKSYENLNVETEKRRMSPGCWILIALAILIILVFLFITPSFRVWTYF